MLEERTIEDAITYRPSGHIEIRYKTAILRDGVEIAYSYQRKVIEPGDDFGNEAEPSKALARLWSQEQIDDARDRKTRG